MSITLSGNNEDLRENKTEAEKVDKLVNQLIASALALRLLNSLMTGSKNNDPIVSKILQSEPHF